MHLGQSRKIVLDINVGNSPNEQIGRVVKADPPDEASGRQGHLDHGWGVKHKRENTVADIFHRVWPSAAIAVGVGVTAVWMAVFGYGLFKLGELAF
jgi:hypothetical protein